MHSRPLMNRRAPASTRLLWPKACARSRWPLLALWAANAIACEPESRSARPLNAAPDELETEDSAARLPREPVVDAQTRTEAVQLDASGVGRAPNVQVDAAPERAADAGPERAADGGPGEPTASALDAGRAGGFAVGTLRIELPTRRQRTLPVQLWYPADETARAEASAGHPIQTFEPEGKGRELLTTLLETAPKSCAARSMHAALGAPPHARATPFPLLAFSHHFEGVRFAMFGIAERLAGLGFVVAAPDHIGGTLLDRPEAYATPLDTEFLQVRALDIRDLLDALLDPKAVIVPEALRGRLDPNRVGMFGHSFGSMTSGVVAASDPRVKAVAFLSFPPANFTGVLNLLGLPELDTFRVPALFMKNEEDVTALVYGNDGIRQQFEAYPSAAWLVEVRDTGHWSFADDCALAPDFANGCGTEDRQTASFEQYTNLDNVVAREIAARYVGAFFAHQLLDAPSDPLSKPVPPDYVTLTAHSAKLPEQD